MELRSGYGSENAMDAAAAGQACLANLGGGPVSSSEFEVDALDCNVRLNCKSCVFV